MLDSGSESNWIASDILKYVKHTYIDTVRLSVRHFGGISSKKFKVVQIYMKRLDGWLPKRKSFKHFGQVYDTIDCLVYEGFFHHRIVVGLNKFISNTKEVSQDVCDQIVDPSGFVDHQDINMGTGLVCPTVVK